METQGTAAPAHVEGFDVSIYVPNGDWQRARATGRDFAFVECARGTILGQYFATQWEACDAAGFVRGAYQRVFSTFSAQSQADAFLSAFDAPGVSLKTTDLPPVLDAEFDDDSGRMAVPAAAFATMLREWVDRVGTALGRRAMIYTGPNFWSTYMGNSAEFAALPLWIAHYHTGIPTVPAPWTSWTFWQYAAEQDVAGFSRPVDVDRFAGTRDDLTRFVARSIVT